MYSDYNVIFYDVEIQNNERMINIESYYKLEEAEEYIKRMIDTKSLDYDEKLVLYKREYDIEKELVEEEIIKEVNW